MDKNNQGEAKEGEQELTNNKKKTRNNKSNHTK